MWISKFSYNFEYKNISKYYIYIYGKKQTDEVEDEDFDSDDIYFIFKGCLDVNLRVSGHVMHFQFFLTDLTSVNGFDR